jgi:sec-independent protein translocase protein TatC
LAAVITPSGDPFTMLVVSVPLYLLYEFSVLICRKEVKTLEEE